ncbi:MAG: hypothetical protein H6607_09370 [Flavobacteriales bacterium]|nr:hypothetical protein [Flavobacteriales bacterium]
MKKWISWLVLAMMMFGFQSVQAQISDLTFDDEYYRLVDRYMVLNNDRLAECTSIKPFNRSVFNKHLVMQPGIATFAPPPKVSSFNNSLFVNDNWDALDSTFYFYKREAKNALLNRFFAYTGSFFSVNEKDFKLVVNPVLAVNGGFSPTENIYRNTRGAELRGSIANKVGFYSFLSENQFRYIEDYRNQTAQTGIIPGTGFIKNFGQNGHDFLNARGYITFGLNKYMTAKFGHDKNFIGNGYRSLIMSDFAKENLFLKIHTRVWKINYVNIFSELTDYQNGGINGLKKKYSAFHYINLRFLNNKAEIGLFENIIFARNDSNQQAGFELNYLNPIIFYRAVEHGLNSSDNAFLGTDWKWNFAINKQFYGQFVLDEFHKNELFGRTGSWVNKWGMQAGVKWFNVLKISNLDFQLETNLVRPYVYTHFKPDQSYTHFDQPIAHPMGANFKEVLAIVRYQPIPKLSFTLKAFNILHGTDSSYTSFTHSGGNINAGYNNRQKEKGIKIGDGLKDKLQIFDVSASYQFYNRTYFDLRLVYRNAKREAPLNSNKAILLMAGLRMNIAQQRFDY